MSSERLVLRALRKEDFLDLTFELVNLKMSGNPQELVRNKVNEPALLIVHFPPQHIVEEVFSARTFTVPGQALIAGWSRLVFQLQDHLNSWPLTLETLLNWGEYEPKLADQALPPDTEGSPDSKEPTREQTALEIPTGLYLSPDKFGEWTHVQLPHEHDGRFELWHTRLRSRKSENPHDGSTARIIWNKSPAIPFQEALSSKDRIEITRLSSDFSIPQIGRWLDRHNQNNNEDILLSRYFPKPKKYSPKPLFSRKLMLSSLGAWANLESAWEYPTDALSGLLGFPKFSLELWHHVAAQGRDQYVKTVKKAVLVPTGHRVSIVSITERKFRIGPTDPNKSTAFLQKFQTIEIQEPLKNYADFPEAFDYNGREMPLKSIQITTLATPVLENFDENLPFWPLIKGIGRPFHFQMIGKDAEGKTVSFQSPLYCVPIKDSLDWGNIVKDYNANKKERWPVNMSAQSIAFGKTDAESLGKTSLITESLNFEAQHVTGDKKKFLPSASPVVLPLVSSAKVDLPSVKELVGRRFPANIEFDNEYLKHGFDTVRNKGEVFLELKPPIELLMSADKAGGLVKPDSLIKGMSRSLGVVNDIDRIKNGEFDISVFDKARFLGGITLKDILKEIGSFDMEKIKNAALLNVEDLKLKLQDPNFHLEVPVLSTKTRPKNQPPGVETQFIWKPFLQNFKDGSDFFEFMTKAGDTGFPKDAQLIINALLSNPIAPNKESAGFNFEGHLTEFALNFVGAMKLKFSSLSFYSMNGKKMEVDAQGMDLEFEGPLKFVNTLKDILPVDGFSDPPYLDVTASGIRAGYTLGVPSVGVGIFSLQNLSLDAGLSLPFIDQPAGVRFAISERQKPFLVTVGLFGGSGFFSIVLSASGIQELEAAIEFGGNISLNLGVASGGVHVMAGIYFGMTKDKVELTGYLRCGGFLNVLGIISITVEFYLGFTYRSKGRVGGEVWGQASLTVGVKVAFFSKTVTLKIERRFAGAAGDPTFADLMGPEIEGEYPEEWDKYCSAFA